MFGIMYADIINPIPSHVKVGLGKIFRITRKIKPNPIMNKRIPVFVHNGHANINFTFY
jgi:hypothetical protein